MEAMNNYQSFLERKLQRGSEHGFDPTFMPDSLFDFQKHLVEFAVRKGRAAIFSDCGTGKSRMQVAWAENVVRKTNGKVLILAPIAVGPQTVREAKKIDIECSHVRDGKIGGKRIVVTNYEQLNKFDPSYFSGAVCDESSILKHFSGTTQKSVTRFMSKIPYRLLCTATAAPNDYTELGTSSEALGELGYSDMLSMFFRQSDNKGHRMQEMKETGRYYRDKGGNHFAKLSFRVSQGIGQWRLKAHAWEPFWKWVCFWARSCRKPSDLGFSDEGFGLPLLSENHHVVKAIKPPKGMLFDMPAFGLGEEREERKRTIQERCEKVADLINHDEPAIVWVQFNDEGNLIGNQIENRYSHWIWRRYASAFWDDVRLNRVLPHKQAKDEEDERHVHPLQLDVIDRALILWSNPGEVVLTPFMGVGSEIFCAIAQSRKGIGIELKEGYYRQAVKNLAEVKMKAEETIGMFVGEIPTVDQEVMA